MKIDQETCFVCGKPIPYSEQPNAVYHAWLRIRYCHNEACQGKVLASARDYSSSKRGKWRKRSEVLAIIASDRT